MATEVPYTGAPQSPTKLDPTPSVSVNAGPTAFGVNVAEALQHLGEVQEGAGKELFDRAYAMQELNAHAKVNSILAQRQDMMTNEFVDYSQTQGKNAVDGFQSF